MAWNWMYIVYTITTSIVSSYFAVSGSSLLLLLSWLPFLVWSSFYSTAQTFSIRPFSGGFLRNPTMCKWSHPRSRSQWSIWVSKHTTPKKISLSPHLHSYNLGVQRPIPPRHRQSSGGWCDGRNLCHHYPPVSSNMASWKILYEWGFDGIYIYNIIYIYTCNILYCMYIYIYYNIYIYITLWYIMYIYILKI